MLTAWYGAFYVQHAGPLRCHPTNKYLIPQPIAGLNLTSYSEQKYWKLKQGGGCKPGKMLMVRENQEAEPQQGSRSKQSIEFEKRWDKKEKKEKVEKGVETDRQMDREDRLLTQQGSKSTSIGVFPSLLGSIQTQNIDFVFSSRMGHFLESNS